MSHHIRTTRVETRRPQPTVGETAPDGFYTRHEHTGADFEEALRNAIARLARRCKTVPPAAREIVYREEWRPASVARLGAAFLACVDDASLPDRAIEQFIAHLEGWLLARRPGVSVSLLTAWSEDTAAQAPADVDQAMALRALETRDPVAIERAVDSTSRHLATLKRLLQALLTEQKQLQYAAGHRRYA